MKKYLALLVFVLVLGLFTGCSLLPTAKPAVNPPVSDLFNYDGLEYHQGEVLVRAAAPEVLQAIAAKHNVQILQEWPELGWSLVTVPAGETPVSFTQSLRKQSGIIMAEPNMVLELHQVPSVDRYGEQWGYNNINAEAGWDITTGDPNVIVAIVDTGVDKTHSEFTDKVFIGSYDATGENLPDVDFGAHGTHVAGIAADDGRTGLIAGVAWDCPIMPVRVENSAGKIFTSYLIEGMTYLGDYAIAHPEYRIVANMSIGGRGYNFAFKDAIDYAWDNGVLLITSAGNDSKRIPGYPSAYNGVVSVAASTPWDVNTSFSTIGEFNSVAAPGTRILSTIPDEGYAFWDGTSMASPFVCGAAALLLSKDPTLTPLEIKNQIEQTARGNGFSEELGYGILDIPALLGDKAPMTYGGLDIKSDIISTQDTGWLGVGIITVFDAEGGLVVYGTTGVNGNYKVHALKPGTYTVNLTYYDDFAGQYSVYSQEATVAVGAEAVVNFDVAAPVSVVRTQLYNEDLNMPEWSYEIPFTIVQVGFYELVTSKLEVDADTVIDLYDSNGVMVARNDDYLDTFSRVAMNLQPGDYTVKVWSFDEVTSLNCTFTIYNTTAIY